MAEEWRQYLDTRYDVSSMGNVRNRDSGKLLKLHLSGGRGGGYFRFRNAGDRKLVLVHRAVATAFLPNPNNLPTVDHIDICQTNNCMTNLRWASHSTQVRNRNAFGAVPFRGVRKQARTGRYESEITVNGKTKHLGTFDTPEGASAAYEAALTAL